MHRYLIHKDCEDDDFCEVHRETDGQRFPVIIARGMNPDDAEFLIRALKVRDAGELRYPATPQETGTEGKKSLSLEAPAGISAPPVATNPADAICTVADCPLHTAAALVSETPSSEGKAEYTHSPSQSRPSEGGGDGQGEGLKLRDCPFCGSTPVEGGNYIECENCGAQFIDSDDVLPAGELMARWNRRTVAS